MLAWPRRMRLVVLLSLAVACSSGGDTTDGGGSDASSDVATGDVITTGDAAGDASGPCTTRVEYGAAWIHGGNHPTDFDVADGLVTWDGTCTDDGANSYAVLSNAWKPYFSGHSACVVALDAMPSCNAETKCTTRVAYGAGWLAPQNHPASYDDTDGRVFGDGICHGGSYANLSNGWQPHYSGGTCPLAFRYDQCGGLYTNPVIAGD